MGIAALVLGIISVVIAAFFAWAGWLGVILGVIGIILGALGKKKGAKCATAGLVLSIIGTGIAVLLWLACAACIGGIASLGAL